MATNEKELPIKEKATMKTIHLNKQLIHLRRNLSKIRKDERLYYDGGQDRIDIKNYYKKINPTVKDKTALFFEYHNLLKMTHKNRVPYYISKDLFLYTWVDLYPDGTVKSIYSGEDKDPERLIIHDHKVIRQRLEKFQQYLQEVNKNEHEAFKELKQFEWKYKLNTEHIVPQSWYSSLEPMKGDLHHLFVCHPTCNRTRSNFPYADFNFYEPKSVIESLKNNCGVLFENKFEPEHGKGEAARAMLYFLVRYPRVIKKKFLLTLDIPLLIRWHNEYKVTLHEKHRNQSIYRIQGNRNPFIDFPDLANHIEFPFNLNKY